MFPSVDPSRKSIENRSRAKPSLPAARDRSLGTWRFLHAIPPLAITLLIAFGETNSVHAQQAGLAKGTTGGESPGGIASTTASSSTSAVDGETGPSLFGPSQKLREGTLIPPTTGRLVNLGRRWALIPIDEPLAVSRDASTSRLNPTTRHGLSLLNAEAQEGRALLNRGVNLDWEANAARPSRTLPAAIGTNQGESGTADPERLRHVILCENQLLQRMVEATRADPSDDTWEVTGEILEFFDQNGLLIRTIRRAKAPSTGNKLHASTSN